MQRGVEKANSHDKYEQNPRDNGNILEMGRHSESTDGKTDDGADKTIGKRTDVMAMHWTCSINCYKTAAEFAVTLLRFIPRVWFWSNFKLKGIQMDEKMPQLPELPEIERHELSNGMHVMLCRQPWLHKVSVLLNVCAGCRDERLPGTAHLLEHLMFRGTKAHPSLRDLSESFESHGADFNAYTAREVTSFDVSMPVSSVSPVMHLLGECMTSPKLTGITAERDIIREEILSDYDADGSLINVEDLLVELFYGEAGKPIAGDPADLPNLSRQEVQAYYQSHYAASNMLLVMSGNIGKSSDVLPLLEASFGDLPSKASRWRRRDLPDMYRQSLSDETIGCQIAPRLVVKKYDGATQSDVILGFLCGACTSHEFSVLEMLVRVLDDGMASRLSRRLVEELALVYDAESYLSVTQESTLMQIRLSCRHRRVSRLLEAVYGLLQELGQNPVPREELTKLRRRVIWEHIGLLDSSASFAQWVSSMALQQMPCQIDERCRKLLEISAEEISNMARKLLSDKPHIVAIVGDLGEKAATEIKETMTSLLDRQVDMQMI